MADLIPSKHYRFPVELSPFQKYVNVQTHSPTQLSLLTSKMDTCTVREERLSVVCFKPSKKRVIH